MITSQPRCVGAGMTSEKIESVKRTDELISLDICSFSVSASQTLSHIRCSPSDKSPVYSHSSADAD